MKNNTPTPKSNMMDRFKNSMKQLADTSLWKFIGKPFLFLLIIIFLFVTALQLILNITTSPFRSSSANINQSYLESFVTTYPENLEHLYQSQIDTPMEDLLTSSLFTSYFFCTPQYPASSDLTTRLRNKLNEYVDGSSYFSSAIVYSGPTNTFLTSQNKENTAVTSFVNSNIEDIIYNYNGSTVNKTQIGSGAHHTFLFKYEEYLVLAKDLTTLSGSPHSTFFVVISPDDLATLLYNANPQMIPYKISAFDLYNEVLFNNTELSGEELQQELARYSGNTSYIEQVGRVYRVYFTSTLLQNQYIAVINEKDLPTQYSQPLLLTIVTIITVVVLVVLALFVILLLFVRPIREFISVMKFDKDESTPKNALSLQKINQEIKTLSDQKQTLQKIVGATSAEALTSLFSRLISAQQVDDEDIAITLSTTAHGFSPDDVYVAGVIKYESTERLDMERRFRILNLINVTFDKFTSKNDSHVLVFPTNDDTFTIIASFSSDTSIAKGKSKINELLQLLQESFDFSGLHMETAFGHMYNSIYDLSFSYNEAMIALNSMRKPVVKPIPMPQEFVASTEDYQQEPLSKALFEEDESDYSTANEGSIDPETIPMEDKGLIDRRASHITTLIFEGKEDQVGKLAERTLEEIFTVPEFQTQYEDCKRLISAMTDYMVSYPFIRDTNLSDVYGELSKKIDKSQSSSEELRSAVQESIQVLCKDFSDILKKQRNPYILAAQKYIEENYQNPDLSLEEIASELKIAPNYLSTVFSKNLGKKLFEYANEYRLEKSIQLLLNTGKSVNDISEESGFGSARNYIRIFKKYKETTPGNYRKQHLNRATNKE